MQRLDHVTVRRMIAEREARAAHGRLVRTLTRTPSPRATSPRPTAQPAVHLLARMGEGIAHRVAEAFMSLRTDRRSQGASSAPSIVAGDQRSPAQVGCV